MAEEPRIRRRDKAADRRAAWHAARMRTARTPTEQLRAASDHLRSAVKHAPRREATRREVFAEVAEHARHVIKEAGLAGASRLLHERQLARGDLGVALMCLASALERLPDLAQRETRTSHYAAELEREAVEIAQRR